MAISLATVHWDKTSIMSSGTELPFLDFIVLVFQVCNFISNIKLTVVNIDCLSGIVFQD